MKSQQNIFLIGPRACGKTSVGLLLADRLGVEFVDTDHALVRTMGSEIAEYVERRGWDAFRDREAETLLREAMPGKRVVGCGGGIVLREENRAILQGGITVYLKVDPEELARRLMADPNEKQRPSLTGKTLVDEVREVLIERTPLYEGCADIVVSGTSPDAVVDQILRELERLS
ncbi:shikimate kinase AroL [uncultured Pseudodesulfovibrio sp.]|uniref:shikimate kinase AroL n=1 Tax=uncultured Pseudodesulfovibrio sp. TaxID=2035858 RepID=UPI0029C88786|nr:shikimate kinase AroL [uncultured Pseudodesulfovibrio sp.]